MLENILIVSNYDGSYSWTAQYNDKVYTNNSFLLSSQDYNIATRIRAMLKKYSFVEEYIELKNEYDIFKDMKGIILCEEGLIEVLELEENSSDDKKRDTRHVQETN